MLDKGIKHSKEKEQERMDTDIEERAGIVFLEPTPPRKALYSWTQKRKYNESVAIWNLGNIFKPCQGYRVPTLTLYAIWGLQQLCRGGWK